MIKKLVALAALAMLLGSPASYAYTTGNNLVEHCKDKEAYFGSGFCYGYMMGVANILTWASERNRICIPDGVTGGQVASIVTKYLKENPESLHESADLLVTVALGKAFPCNN